MFDDTYKTLAAPSEGIYKEKGSGCYVKHLNGEELDFKHVKRMLRDIRRETEKWKKEILKQQKKKQKR